MIRLAELSELDRIFSIYRQCDIKMQAQGYTYWINYPKKHQTEGDILSQTLYTYTDDSILKAVISLDEEQFFPWKLIKWKDTKGKALIVHRLAVLPEFQGQYLGHKLMTFAEEWAKENSYTSIRLDASSDNQRVHSFYSQLGYRARGEIYLPVRDFPFTCYEKVIGS